MGIAKIKNSVIMEETMKKILFIVLAVMMLTAGIVYAIVSPPFGQVVCNSSTATAINPAGNYNTLMITNITPSASVYITPLSSITTTSAGVLLSANTGTVFTDTAKAGLYNNTIGYASWYCLTTAGSATVLWQVR